MAEDKGYELFKKMAYATFKIRGVFLKTDFYLCGYNKERGEIRINTDHKYVHKEEWEHVLGAIKSSGLEIAGSTIVAEDDAVHLEFEVSADGK